ncbi:hypothetical protein RSAG8_07352, partial [Rhizoctonia solani AG-8 WAC10335]
MYWKPFGLPKSGKLLVLNNEVCDRMVILDTQLLALLNPRPTHSPVECKSVRDDKIGAQSDALLGGQVAGDNEHLADRGT